MKSIKLKENEISAYYNVNERIFQNGELQGFGCREDDDIVGVIIYEIFDNNCSLSYIWVDESFTGKRVSDFLMEKFLSMVKDKDCNITACFDCEDPRTREIGNLLMSYGFDIRIENYKEYTIEIENFEKILSRSSSLGNPAGKNSLVRLDKVKPAYLSALWKKNENAAVAFIDPNDVLRADAKMSFTILDKDSKI
nr:GNAT family N-acetyltransferase [Lachnospiraceae bacterium]